MNNIEQGFGIFDRADVYADDVPTIGDQNESLPVRERFIIESSALLQSMTGVVTSAVFENPFYLEDGVASVHIVYNMSLLNKLKYLKLIKILWRYKFKSSDIDRLNKEFNKIIEVRRSMLQLRKVSKKFVDRLLYLWWKYYIDWIYFESIDVIKKGPLDRVKIIKTEVWWEIYSVKFDSDGGYMFINFVWVCFKIVSWKFTRVEYENLSLEHEKYQMAILNVARSFSNSPYDTWLDNVDGSALKLWKESKNWVYKCSRYLMWDYEIWDEKPLVCVDLVIDGLVSVFGNLITEISEKTYKWDIEDLGSECFKMLRRVKNFEKIVSNNDNFYVKQIDYVFDGDVGSIPGKYYVGDIITTRKWWSRHIGIVSSVDKNWKPLMVIQSNYSWVSETLFYTEEEEDIVWWRVRNLWFIKKGTELVKLVRPSYVLLKKIYK